MFAPPSCDITAHKAPYVLYFVSSGLVGGAVRGERLRRTVRKREAHQELAPSHLMITPRGVFTVATDGYIQRAVVF